MSTKPIVNSTLIVHEIGKTQLLYIGASSALQTKIWELHKKLNNVEDELATYRAGFWFLLAMFVLCLAILAFGVIYE